MVVVPQGFVAVVAILGELVQGSLHHVDRGWPWLGYGTLGRRFRPIWWIHRVIIDLRWQWDYCRSTGLGFLRVFVVGVGFAWSQGWYGVARYGIFVDGFNGDRGIVIWFRIIDILVVVVVVCVIFTSCRRVCGASGRFWLLMEALGGVVFHSARGWM
jgi:hypothetical protein